MIKKTIIALIASTVIVTVSHAAQTQPPHRDWWEVDFQDASCPTISGYDGDSITDPAQDEAALLSKIPGTIFHNDPRTGPDGSEVLFVAITGGPYKGKFLQFATSLVGCQSLITFDEKNGYITAPNPLQ